jgi:hypothetical protein
MAYDECQGNNEHQRGTMYIHQNLFAYISTGIAAQSGYLGANYIVSIKEP